MKTKRLTPTVAYLLAFMAVFVLAVLLVGHAAAAAGRALDVSAASPLRAHALGTLELRVPRVEAPPKNTAAYQAVATYVRGAIGAWMKGPAAGETVDLDEAARDIAAVGVDESKVKPGSVGAYEALVLASLAFNESRFRAYVDDQSCNRWAREAYAKVHMLNLRVLDPNAQKHMTLGTCDGGRAYSLWQLHIGDGEILRHATPAEISDRRAAARYALAIARRSIIAGAGLCQYSGEPGPCPKAAKRLELADTYWIAHPFR